MMGISPVALAFTIVLCVAAVGAIIAMVRRTSVFAGYSEIAADARQLAVLLKGEVSREGQDLLVTGTCGKLATTIRFSRADDTPGLNIRMAAAATFSMALSPRGESAGEGRYLLRTPDENFDVRFVIRSDHPTQARMFLGGRAAFAALQKLSTSGTTFLTISPGALELSELAFPTVPASRRISNLLLAMADVAKELNAMPGAHLVEVKSKRHGTSIIVRVAIAAGIMAALAAVFATSNQVEDMHASPAAQGSPSGISPADAAHIFNLKGWRLAAAQDFDPDASGWLRNSGVQVSGRMPGDFTGAGSSHDVAYVLADDQGKRRILLLSGGETRYDTSFDSMGIAVRVPKANVAAIQWAGTPPPEFDGDGLLIVRTPQDRHSGLVLFINGLHIISAIPADYQSINLTE
jgi:hypothetical protein